MIQEVICTNKINQILLNGSELNAYNLKYPIVKNSNLNLLTEIRVKKEKLLEDRGFSYDFIILEQEERKIMKHLKKESSIDDFYKFKAKLGPEIINESLIIEKRLKDLHLLRLRKEDSRTNFSFFEAKEIKIKNRLKNQLTVEGFKLFQEKLNRQVNLENLLYKILALKSKDGDNFIKVQFFMESLPVKIYLNNSWENKINQRYNLFSNESIELYILNFLSDSEIKDYLKSPLLEHKALVEDFLNNDKIKSLQNKCKPYIKRFYFKEIKDDPLLKEYFDLRQERFSYILNLLNNIERRKKVKAILLNEI